MNRRVWCCDSVAPKRVVGAPQSTEDCDGIIREAGATSDEREECAVWRAQVGPAKSTRKSSRVASRSRLSAPGAITVMCKQVIKPISDMNL